MKGKMIKKNEGNLDRIIRIVLGLVLFAVAYLQNINWLYIIALVSLVTGLTGFCGLYKLLGINTCPMKKK